MNICFVETNYPTSKGGGGAGTYVRLLGKELARLGHKVMVISKHIPEEPKVSEVDGVEVFRIPFGNLHWYFSKLPVVGKIFSRPLRYLENSFAVHKKILELNDKYDIDLIEFTESGDFWMPIWNRIPYLVHLHGSSYTFKKYCNEKIETGDKLQRLLEGFFIRRAKFISSPSYFLRNEIKDEFSINENLFHVIPYPLDPAILSYEGKQKTNSNFKTIFYAGRIERRKGVHTLVEAIPKIRRKFKNTRFCFFGSQSSELIEDYIMNYLRSFNEDYNIEINQYCPKEILMEHLFNSDICVIPSLWDNSPNTAYEAMAAGKAVVACKTGGIPEIIEDNNTGILVPPGNSNALAKGIISLLENDGLRKEMGKNGQMKIRDLCDLKKNVEKRLLLYKKVN